MKRNKLFEFDKEKSAGVKYLIGTDEAGRGAGAGPVCAAAVCFPEISEELVKSLEKLNDSKKLSAKVREELFDVIVKQAVYSVCFGSVEDIEKYNILRTSLNTMNTACNEVAKQLRSEVPIRCRTLPPSEQGRMSAHTLKADIKVKILIDGNQKIPGCEYDGETVVKGDGKSAVIAAAGILAKVSRDRFMNELDKRYPQYCWKKNKGYMTQSHLDGVDKYGLCPLHRRKYFDKHFEKSAQLTLSDIM